MLLYTILDPMAVMEQPVPPVSGYRQLNPFCICQWTGEGSERHLTRVLSTDLSSYLDPGLQPGTEWGIRD